MDYVSNDFEPSAGAVAMAEYFNGLVAREQELDAARAQERAVQPAPLDLYGESLDAFRTEIKEQIKSQCENYHTMSEFILRQFEQNVNTKAIADEERLTRSLAEDRAAHARSLEDERALYAKSLEDERALYAKSLEAERAAHAKSSEADRTAYKESLEADWKAHKESLEADRKAHEESLRADRNAHKESLQADRTAHKESLETDRATHPQQLDDNADEHLLGKEFLSQMMIREVAGKIQSELQHLTEGHRSSNAAITSHLETILELTKALKAQVANEGNRTRSKVETRAEDLANYVSGIEPKVLSVLRDVGAGFRTVLGPEGLEGLRADMQSIAVSSRIPVARAPDQSKVASFEGHSGRDFAEIFSAQPKNTGQQVPDKDESASPSNMPQPSIQAQVEEMSSTETNIPSPKNTGKQVPDKDELASPSNMAQPSIQAQVEEMSSAEPTSPLQTKDEDEERMQVSPRSSEN